MDAATTDTNPMLYVLLLVMYLIPTIIAFYRDHPNTGKVFLLNFFLGWTGIGWIVAGIWALFAERKKKRFLIIEEE